LIAETSLKFFCTILVNSNIESGRKIPFFTAQIVYEILIQSSNILMRNFLKLNLDVSENFHKSAEWIAAVQRSI
jgi:hypothetical protein